MLEFELTEKMLKIKQDVSVSRHNVANASTRLSVSDLHKSFLSPAGENIEVLRGVSFDVGAGESLAIIGASGAGKSTLLHLLSGLEEPDRGHIVLNGVAVDSGSRDALAALRKNQIGFVFQFHHLLPDLTARENVALPLMIRGTTQRESMIRARDALERVGLRQRMDHPISYLSGGEQQRVAVSRALITAPVLVLADEPTGNLDSAFGKEINEILLSYTRDREGILILATHNEKFARMCDQIQIIKEGRLDRL